MKTIIIISGTPSETAEMELIEAEKMGYCFRSPEQKINTIPDMTETSALPAAAQAAGITMEKLVSEIAFQSMKRSWDKA